MLAQADQGNIAYGYFPTKTWICGSGKHCTVIFLCNIFSDVFGKHWLCDFPMQCRLSLIDATLYRLLR